MAKQDFIVGIEIVNADSKGIEKLVDKISAESGLGVYQIDNRVIVTSDKSTKDEELVGIIEDVAFDLGIDNTQIKLVYVEMETSKIIESQSAVLEFMREYGVSEDEIPISVFPDMMEFIREYNESVENEVNSYSDSSSSKPISKEISKAENTQTETPIVEAVQEDEDEDEFEDNVDFDASPTASIERTNEADEQEDEDVNKGFESLISQLEAPTENEKESLEIRETPQITFNRSKVEPEDTLEQTQASEADLNNFVDPLMKVAVGLFTKQHLKQLPVFDELTQRELQKEIVSANYNSEQAKQESVVSIYQRLKQQEADMISEIENSVLSQAKERHEAVLGKLKNNLEVDKQATHRERSDAYSKRKQEFVNSQLNELEMKYDSDNLRNFQEELNLTLDNIEKQAEKKIRNENKLYEEYRNKVIEEQKQMMIDSFDVTKEVSRYNDTVDSEQKNLIKEAESFKGQVGNATFEIQKENEQLLKQLKELDSENKIQKETEKQRIESQIAMAVADNKHEHEQREMEIKQRYEDELAKLKALYEEKEQELSAERKNIASINQALDAKSRDLEVMQIAKAQMINGQQGQPQPQQAVNPTTGVQAFKLPRSIVATVVGLGVLLLISLGTTFFTLANSHSKTTEASTAPSEVVKNSVADTTNSSFEVGKTYPYTTSSGEKVKLIIDDEQSGHYVDKDGKYHSVLLVN